MPPNRLQELTKQENLSNKYLVELFMMMTSRDFDKRRLGFRALLMR